jgi:hypothetical protein
LNKKNAFNLKRSEINKFIVHKQQYKDTRFKDTFGQPIAQEIDLAS